MADIPRVVADRIKNAGRSITSLSVETGIAEKTLRRRLAAPENFTLAELAALGRATSLSLEGLLSATAEPESSAA